jgi:hypothetical protein
MIRMEQVLVAKKMYETIQKAQRKVTSECVDMQ